MSETEWTSDPPIVPGLYWYALIGSEGVRRHTEVYIPEFGKHKGHCCIVGGSWDAGSAAMLASRPHRVWCGPLRPPTGAAQWAENAPVGSDS